MFNNTFWRKLFFKTCDTMYVRISKPEVVLRNGLCDSFLSTHIGTYVGTLVG